MDYKIATRRSKLALVQTDYIIEEIKTRFNIHCEKLLVETEGDKKLDVTLDKIGGKGLFVKDIEIAMLEGRAQAAVHSMKDVPYDIEQVFELAAMPIREDVRDAFISADGRPFSQLPEGAVIGTSSHRRSAQLKLLRPDIKIVPIRGNVQTRIAKIEKENLDGIILAYAGLKRLGYEHQAASIFSTEEIVPAVGQGALGIETVKGSEFTAIVKGLDNEEVRCCVEAERSFMKSLNGGCHTCIGAYAKLQGDIMHITGIFELNGKVIKKDVTGNKADNIKLGRQLAEKILEG